MPKTKQKSAQDIQDEIFRKMSSDRKIKLAADLWRLAKAIDSDKIKYGINRPAQTSHNSRRDS
ncbi:hypothetical protein A3C78_02480 [Candidatus Azambacteria bacterium RIFCSPHIGHO2_02_FULL_45_18]|uniref:Uncharacterized protein n=1 Tax=Candidatus Azambacteria bacterium RIFCSPLOWO2_02_FULL_44_14 TaxID=1797306 RepID=A0A1F5C9W5_9BACT|nr:MAG: hypothetical protein A3C78_02480 [Candidatus Azambacteria bacterium RIFCSPHIGHO2_02_FULL_45_18]OGD39646.1 MAG: hypothetical protein A3I30_04085 [Candidatus Azambacteria bacterium RIFCSPLOWO2_02_FULL_44_14]